MAGWLLAEKPLNSQTILGISVGTLPAAGSLDDFVHFRRIGDLLALHNPSSSAVASVLWTCVQSTMVLDAETRGKLEMDKA